MRLVSMGMRLVKSSYLPMATFNVSIMIAVNSAESERPGNRELLAEVTDQCCFSLMFGLVV